MAVWADATGPDESEVTIHPYVFIQADVTIDTPDDRRVLMETNDSLVGSPASANLVADTPRPVAFVPVRLEDALLHNMLVRTTPVPEFSPEFIHCLEGPSLATIERMADLQYNAARQAALFSNEEHCPHDGVECDNCTTCDGKLCEKCASICTNCLLPRCAMSSICKTNHVCFYPQ